MGSDLLEKLLQDIMEWCKRLVFRDVVYFPWDDEQLETLLSYVSNVGVDSRFSSRMYEKFHLDQAWQDRHRSTQKCNRAAQLVRRILGDLGGLFKVPKLQQLSRSHMEITLSLKKDELVAGFINFLLHLLHCDQDFTALYECRNVVDRVVKELRILLTLIGDKPFQAVAHEGVQSSILEEFEVVVNEAGALVHSLVFTPELVVPKMNEALDTLLEHIQLLKTNMTKFLQLFPNIVFTHTPNSSMDSPFILCCLMHDLEDLIDLDDNNLVEVKEQCKTLHEWVLLCQSLFTGTEIEELKNKLVAVQIIAVAYDAKYLISAFLDGEVPLWYLTMRLTHINEITLDATRLQEMKQEGNPMISKQADDFRSQLAPQAKKDSLPDDVIVGFEKQEEHILDLLIHGTEALQEVFIYGMPGIGKTTLARRIYRHPSVSFHFDRSIWCVVSQCFKRKNLLIGIWFSIKSDSKKKKKKKKQEEEDEEEEEEEQGWEKRRMKEEEDEEEEEWCLEYKIYQTLKGRRYLLVLDDFRFLPDEGNGSRILFTSRNKDVAPCGGNVIIHELPILSNHQCWELLEKKVFHNNPCPPQLQEIGRRIAAKCYGLPLVVVVVAGILSTMNLEESTWENMSI